MWLVLLLLSLAGFVTCVALLAADFAARNAVRRGFAERLKEIK